MLEFHPASESNIETLRTLAERIWRESYAEIILPEQISYMLAWMYSDEAIRREMAGGVYWELVRLAGQNIGYWSVTLQPDGVAKLDKLYLLAAHHKEGWGQTILAHVFDLAAVWGVREVRLQVNKANLRAQRAYERFGFRRLSEGCFDIGAGYFMDDYIFSKNVSVQQQDDTFSV